MRHAQILSLVSSTPKCIKRAKVSSEDHPMSTPSRRSNKLFPNPPFSPIVVSDTSTFSPRVKEANLPYTGRCSPGSELPSYHENKCNPNQSLLSKDVVEEPSSEFSLLPYGEAQDPYNLSSYSRPPSAQGASLSSEEKPSPSQPRHHCLPHTCGLGLQNNTVDGPGTSTVRHHARLCRLPF